MEKKYYTPGIEEFHVGFNYEHLPMKYLWYLNGLGPKGKWLKETFAGGAGNDGESEVHELHTLIDDEAVRVKYLDREDIESLKGWHKGYSGARYEGVVGWDEVVNDNADTIRLFDDGSVVIKKVYAGHHLVAFKGKLKNKSELKRILKQIGI